LISNTIWLSYSTCLSISVIYPLVVCNR